MNFNLKIINKNLISYNDNIDTFENIKKIFVQENKEYCIRLQTAHMNYCSKLEKLIKKKILNQKIDSFIKITDSHILKCNTLGLASAFVAIGSRDIEPSYIRRTNLYSRLIHRLCGIDEIPFVIMSKKFKITHYKHADLVISNEEPCNLVNDLLTKLLPEDTVNLIFSFIGYNDNTVFYVQTEREFYDHKTVGRIYVYDCLEYNFV